jgi:predicted dienelactone hydrolase
MKRLWLLATMVLTATLSVVVAGRAAPSPEKVTVCEAEWRDPARGGRVVPVRIRLPTEAAHVPVILFSHGLGGSLDAGTDWVEAWAAAGFATVNLQHAGSDTGVWRGKAHPLEGLREAMTPEQLRNRANDVHFVLDELAKGGAVTGPNGSCDLGRLDMSRLGMSGHSFGAQTTLAISGARYGGLPLLQDKRIAASIAFSPQPAQGQDDHAAFGGITIPFFTVTGTRDVLPMSNAWKPQDRQRPYEAMTGGGKYLLVIDGANHMMLGGQTLPMRNNTPPPAMVVTVTAATTLFWRATLLGDRDAAAELRRFGVHLSAGDRFAAK